MSAATETENGAARAPAPSPLIEEVGADHPMREAIETADAERRVGGLGKPGRALNRRSPFFIGMTAAAGVAVTYGLIELLIKARSVLILIGLAFFIAAGPDPVVAWLTRRGWPRWAAVTAVIFALIALFGGFIATAVPPLAAQTSALISQLPHYLHELQNHSSTLGKLNDKNHIQQRVTSLLSTKGGALIGGVIGAGQIVLSALSSMVLVAVMTVYFLAAMPRTKLLFYRLIPHSRRPRAILLGDEIFTKVGGYVLGNVITSFIAGAGTFFWMLAWGIPYRLAHRAHRVHPGGDRDGDLLRRLPAGRGLSARAADHRAHGQGARCRRHGRDRPGRRADGHHRALIAIPAAASISLLLEEVAFRRLDDS